MCQEKGYQLSKFLLDKNTMKIIEWERGYLSPFEKSVLTVGNFDGVHLGHQEIFREVVKKANETGGVPCLVTFNPHPQKLFSGEEPPLITSFEQKLEIIESFGIEVVFVAGRDIGFYMMEAREFVITMLVNSLHIAHIFVGHDFRFGKGQTGDFELLKQMGEEAGFVAHEMGAVTIEGVLVSSTMVRNLIVAGEVAEATILLGREYCVKGGVITGSGRGKGLGFPTANLEVKGSLIPKDGVYVVKVELDGGIYGGVANLGDNPTFNNGKFSFEVHIFDYTGDLTGRQLSVFFVSRIRDEIKFKGPDALVERIKKDVTIARKIL